MTTRDKTDSEIGQEYFYGDPVPMKAGASEYLTKPADSEEFIAAIERLLHRDASTG